MLSFRRGCTGWARDGVAPYLPARGHRRQNGVEDFQTNLSPQQEVHHPIGHVQSSNVQRILSSRLAGVNLGTTPQQREDNIAAAVVPGGGEYQQNLNLTH